MAKKSDAIFLEQASPLGAPALTAEISQKSAR
jgi:hypothetical protein